MSGINKKILHVQQNVQVEKTGYNEKHEFSYFKEEDVLNAVKVLLNELKVIIRKETLEYHHEAFYDSNGRYRPRANAMVAFTFVDTDDDSEFRVVVAAEGSGTGDDVSSRKLATQARKIALLDTFLITEANDKYDGDATSEQEPVNQIPVDAPEVGPSLNQLQARIGEFVNDKGSAVTGGDVNKLGTKFAKELKVSDDPKVWRKDINVLAQVVASLERGEVE